MFCRKFELISLVLYIAIYIVYFYSSNISLLRNCFYIFIFHLYAKYLMFRH